MSECVKENEDPLGEDFHDLLLDKVSHFVPMITCMGVAAIACVAGAWSWQRV